jgi:hypothetical protein
MTGVISQPDIDQWVGHILADLAENPPPPLRIPGGGGQVVQVKTQIRSTIVYANLGADDNVAPIVVKFLRGDNASVKSESEYTALCQMASALQDRPELAVPVPLRHYPEFGAVVMSKCNGHSVTRVLTRAAWCLTRRRKDRCLTISQQCGRWLSVLHSIQHASRPRCELVEAQLRSVEKRLDLVQRKTDSQAPAWLITRLRERYGLAMERSPWATLPMGLTHHDFGAHNNLVTDRQFTALDLGDASEDFGVEDVVRFIFELRTLNHSRMWRWNGNLFAECERAFRAAYGTPVNREIERFFLLKCTLMMLLSIRSSSTTQFAYSWHRRAIPHLDSILHSLATAE